jgi:hypothetical protein
MVLNVRRAKSGRHRNMSDDLRNRIEDVRADFASGAQEGPEILSNGRAGISFQDLVVDEWHLCLSRMLFDHTEVRTARVYFILAVPHLPWRLVFSRSEASS